MGISTFPNTVSPIKSLQRGIAAGGGDITISAVVMSKTITNSFPTVAGGTVGAVATLPAMTGTVAATNVYVSGFTANFGFTGGNYTSQIANYNASNANYNAGTPSAYNSRYAYVSYNSPQVAGYNTATPNYTNVAASGVNANLPFNSTTVGFNAQALVAGDTNLYAAQYGVYLKNSTTITATGPCRYEVVEYY